MNRSMNEMADYVISLGKKNNVPMNHRDILVALYEDGDPVPNEMQCENLFNETAREFLIQRYANLHRYMMTSKALVGTFWNTPGGES